MGCFIPDGPDDSEEDVPPLHRPLPPEQPTFASSDEDRDADVDPYLAGPHFPALASTDILRAIFEILQPRDLARAACVCRAWSILASEREVLEKAFASPWKVRRVVGEPSSAAFWRRQGLGRFAISHRLRRRDSIASLALKYSVQVMDIKRLNNMMSEHGIYSRDRLLIPICNPDLLRDRTCYIEMDVHAKREVAVLYLDGQPDPDSLARRNFIVTEEGRRKILDSIRRSMGVDDGTAAYYMSIADGDPRAAFLQFSKDLGWENHSGAP